MIILGIPTFACLVLAAMCLGFSLGVVACNKIWKSK